MTYREHDTLDALVFLSAHTLAEQNANDLLSTDLSGIERPRSLDRRVGRLIRHERRAEQAGGFRRVAKNFLIALLVCCTVAFSLVMSIEGVRNAVFEAVLEWYNDYIAILYKSKNDGAVLANSILQTREPNEIPPEWRKRVELDTAGIYALCYLNAGGETQATYTQRLVDGTSHVDSSCAIISDVRIGMYDAKLIFWYDDGTCMLDWTDGHYAYALRAADAAIDSETLIRIAESVR